MAPEATWATMVTVSMTMLLLPVTDLLVGVGVVVGGVAAALVVGATPTMQWTMTTLRAAVAVVSSLLVMSWIRCREEQAWAEDKGEEAPWAPDPLWSLT